MAVKTIPDGFHGVTPYLCCAKAAEAIEFYKRAFGAEELMRLSEPSGRVGHAQLRIAGALIMVADEYPEMDIRSPKSIGGTGVSLHLYVEDVDAVVRQAIAAGAQLLRPVADQFYGDRSGSVTDPYGHRWMIATHKVDVTADEMQRRWTEMLKQ